MQPFLVILTLVTFAITMVVAPIAWFRIVRAKTRTAYWKNIAVFAGSILLVFLLAHGAGLMPEVPEQPMPPSAQEIFGHMSTAQLAFLIAAAVLWIGGGNLLFYLHNRRRGKTFWQALNPFDPPLKDFNTREWLILGGLVVASTGLGALAISFSHAA